MKADNRKHHTIPVCYFRSWQQNPRDRKGDIAVEFLRSNKGAKIRRVSPTSISKYAGYNDLSKSPLFSQTPSLLETGILANGVEAGYANIMSNTIRLGIEPTGEQLKFLAKFCMTLWARSTVFEPIADAFLITLDKDERRIIDRETLRLAMIIQIMSDEIPFFSIFHRVVGSSLLMSSDAPCWPWLQTNKNDFYPITDVHNSRKIVLSGLASGRYICPLTPKHLLEVFVTTHTPINLLEDFMTTNGTQLHNSTLNEDEVEEYNRAIRATANHLLIHPSN